MSAEDAPNLTSSDQSSGEEFSESEMEGTSDYGSKYAVLIWSIHFNMNFEGVVMKMSAMVPLLGRIVHL